MESVRSSVAAVAGVLAGAAALTFSSVAFAQDEYPEPPKPPVPEPADATRMAGVGSNIPYAEAGTVEAGGSLGLTLANDSTIINADPMIGYFLWDNIELSGILGVQYTSTDGQSSSLFSLVLEPSFHYPFTDRFFGFIGVGGGLALSNDGQDATEENVGFAVAPRIGVQYLVGRSGILNIGFRPLFSLVEVESTGEFNPYGAQGYLALQNNYSLQVGYTVLF